MDIQTELEQVKTKIAFALEKIAQAGATGEVAAYQDQGLSVSVRKQEVASNSGLIKSSESLEQAIKLAISTKNNKYFSFSM